MKKWLLILAFILPLVLLISCLDRPKTVQGMFSECTIWFHNEKHVAFYDCKIGDEYLYIKESEMPDWELGRSYVVTFRDSTGDKYFNEILAWQEAYMGQKPAPVHPVMVEELQPQ